MFAAAVALSDWDSPEGSGMGELIVSKCIRQKLGHGLTAA
jgi:hypothetical protein